LTINFKLLGYFCLFLGLGFAIGWLLEDYNQQFYSCSLILTGYEKEYKTYTWATDEEFEQVLKDFNASTQQRPPYSWESAK